MDVIHIAAGPSQIKYEHSDKISNRRKALFPASDSGSDLGHMSPIHSDNSNFSDCALAAMENEADNKFRKLFKCNLDDYVLLDNDTDILTPDPCSESSVPALYLSPMHSLLSTPILYSPMHTTKILTPMTKSPSSTLKTPHDTSTIKVNQKHTKRRLISDATESATESQSPNCKIAKTAESKSKVRTALFPENDIVLPADSFYPKEMNMFNAQERIAALVAASKTRNVPQVKFSHMRKYTSKRRYGEINAGVRHKIKKPKQKMVSKAKIVKAAIKVIEKSPLTEYLEEMTSVKKTIKPLPNNNTTLSNKENYINMKRETVTNRKFFKTLRSGGKQESGESSEKQPLQDVNKAHVTNNITPPNKCKLDTSCFELSIEKEENCTDINKIIDTLEKENALKPALNPNLIFSPTAQMCDMASALDLNSPKRAKLNISKMLSEGTVRRPQTMLSSVGKIEKSTKLFPLFYADKNKTIGITEQKQVKKVGQQFKKLKPIDENQLLIDAGQKKFGAVECAECTFVYEVGDPMDEMIHQTYHNATNTFKFNGWKNERVIASINLETKIIKIIPGDMRAWWKKCTEVVEYINRELGFYDGVLPIEKSQVYLYVKNKRIVGCIVAEMKQKAYKMLPSDADIKFCSEESYVIRCGISRIWVAPQHRRSGIASQMMDSLRRNFLHGYILNLNEIALSSPTDLGHIFAQKYFKTESFLIYIN